MTDGNKLRAKLIERREELNIRINNIKRDVTSKASADWSEQAQERENDEVIDAIGNEATLELQKINRALDRMDEGEYGYCTACTARIPDDRLEVMPYADLCVKCAESKGF